MSPDLCQASDELTPHDKAAEILPISVQQLYVLSKLGKVDQAEKLVSEISVSEYVFPRVCFVQC
jgi:signal recognition particle subunit SRP72